MPQFHIDGDWVKECGLASGALVGGDHSGIWSATPLTLMALYSPIWQVMMRLWYGRSTQRSMQQEPRDDNDHAGVPELWTSEPDSENL